MSLINEVELKDISDYGTEKIDAELLNSTNYISTENLIPEKGGAVNSDYLPTKGRVSKYSVGDSLVSNIRPYFKKILFAKESGGCSNDVIVFKPRLDKIDPKYLYYQLSKDEFFDFMMAGANGVKMPRGNKNSIPLFKILLPSLPTQRRIASILSAYDDLIENNIKRIKLLYEAAQLLYDKLINEEKEFKTVQLEGISNYLGRGVTPQYQDGSSFFAINQKANKGLFLEEQYFKEYKIGDWVPKEKFAMNGDVLINCLGEGTIGRCHFFKGEDNKYPVDQHMTIFRGKTKEISLFVFQFLDSELGQGLLYSLKKGGTNMTMLNISDLRSLKIDLPIDRILSNHYIITESLFRQKAILEKQNQKLKESRDILLPKLMNPNFFKNVI
jgi:type I restriction enzyme S subunit